MIDGWVIVTVIQEIITSIMLETGEVLERFLLLVEPRMILEQSGWSLEVVLLDVRHEVVRVQLSIAIV